MSHVHEKEGQFLRGIWQGKAVTRSMSFDGPLQRNHHDLFFVLPDFVQCLCNQSHWGKCILGKVLGPAVCQCVRAEGGLGQEIPQRAMGGFLGSKQVYLHFTESIQNQLNHLSMDSPLPLKCYSSREHVSCTIELTWNVSGLQ